MKKNTCIVCSNEFEPRAGKLYCSNACKQKALSVNKKQSELREEKAEETTLIKIQLEFNFKEYQEYLVKYPDDIANFQLYCFLRKNLQGKPMLDDIHNYIKSFDQNWWMNFYHEESNIVQKKYKEFESKFFSEEVKIHFSTRTNEIKSENKNDY